MDRTGEMALMALLVATALMERLARWDREGRMAPREPTEHPALLGLLVWTGLLGFLGAMDATVLMALMVPLGLLAHRAHLAHKALLAQPAATE